MKLKYDNKFMQIVTKELNFPKDKLSCEKILDVLDKLEINKEERLILKNNKNIKLGMYFKHFYNIFKRKIFVLLVESKIIIRNIDRLYLYPKLSNGINKNEALYYLRQIDKNLDKKLNLTNYSNNLISFDNK